MSDKAFEGYGPAFEQIDANGGRFTVVWNWASFFFGPLWYLSKGLWVKAILYFVLLGILGSFTFGSLGLAGWIALGLVGTYDLYLLARRGTQLWENMPPGIAAALNTPAAQPDPALRLRALDDARARGVITESEYQDKLAALQREAMNASRLADLDRALRSGVLTREEYEAKRQALLNS